MTSKFLAGITMAAIVAFLPAIALAAIPKITVGMSTGPNVVFSFDRGTANTAGQVRIMTRLVGAPGARLTIATDQLGKPLFSRLLATDDCAFDNDGAKCRLTISDRRAYRQFVAAFKHGHSVHVEVQHAGVMLMDVKASLKGFTRVYGR